MGTIEPARIRGARSLRACGRATALATALALSAPVAAVETAILSSPVPAATAELAYSIDVDGTRIVLGAPGENAGAGAVYVFDCANLPCIAPQRLAPVDAGADDELGTAVAISGDTLVATAPGPEPGAAYVYVFDDGAWTQQAKLTPGGGSTGEHFGAAVAMSGDRIAIGADQAGFGAGAVYVFVRSGASWVQEARLSAGDAAPRDAFGTSVALDADTLVAGAPIKRTGAAGSYANGAAYVFSRGGGTWTQQARLTASGANGDLFGFSVDAAGDRAVVGAPYAANARGTAYVFSRSGSAWSQQTQLNAASGAAGDEFGWSVALGSDRVVVGAPFTGQLAEAACGHAYVFEGAALAEGNAGAVTAPVLNELTGWSVAASGQSWAASAPGHAIGPSDHAGAAYWFDGAITIFQSGFDTLSTCIDPDEDD